MIQANKYRTTFRRLQPGMSVFHNEEIIKIIRLRERKLTDRGLLYYFDVEGGNGTLIGESGKRIFVAN